MLKKLLGMLVVMFALTGMMAADVRPSPHIPNIDDEEVWMTVGENSYGVGYKRGWLGVEISRQEMPDVVTFKRKCGKTRKMVTPGTDEMMMDVLVFVPIAPRWDIVPGVGFYNDDFEGNKLTGRIGFRHYFKQRGITAGMALHTEQEMAASVGWRF